jgi:hypothetical protein
VQWLPYKNPSQLSLAALCSSELWELNTIEPAGIEPKPILSRPIIFDGTDVLLVSSAETHKPAESLNVVPPPVDMLDTCVTNLRLGVCASGARARGESANRYTEFPYCADTVDLCYHEPGAW